MKHHRRTNEQMDADKERIIELLDKGVCPKAISQELGISIQAIYNQAHVLGYRMRMVRQEMLRELILGS